jgi:hypothetical protein
MGFIMKKDNIYVEIIGSALALLAFFMLMFAFLIFGGV